MVVNTPMIASLKLPVVPTRDKLCDNLTILEVSKFSCSKT